MVSKQYLPYTAMPATADGPGGFREGAEQEALAFYADPPAAVEGSLYPFAVTVYDKSPQNKVLQQGAPGEEWQVDMGHPVSITSATNSLTEVVTWEVDPATGSLLANAWYPANQLIKTVVVNEDGEKTVSYSDMLGRQLKQAMYLSEGEAIETYFVYNNRGSLLYKIPPLVVEQATAQPTLPYVIDKTVVENLCYSYIYDERERLIETRWADKEAIYFVYDPWDRLVLSQDGNQRLRNEWSFTKYDRYDRTVLSGLFDTTAVLNQSGMASVVNAHYAKSPTFRFETYGGDVHGYTNVSYPVLADEDAYLAVSYFDSYSFINDVEGFGAAYAFDANFLGCETVPQGTYCYPSGGSNNLLGMATGSKARVLQSGPWLSSVAYYDQQGRAIQAVSENHAGGIGRASSLYNFAGWPLSTYMDHTGPDGISRGIKRRYTYGHTGRLLAGYHEIYENGVGQGEVFLAENKYNELGELVEKNLHITQGVPIQSIDYRYNIRGWLKSINGAGLGTGQDPDGTKPDLFGMDMIYEGVLNGIQNE